VAELLGQVLYDYAVTGREEGQHVLQEIFFVLGQSLPVLEVRGKVDFLGRPKGSLVLLVHLVNVLVPDGEQHKSALRLVQQGFRGQTPGDWRVIGVSFRGLLLLAMASEFTG
jgi:hypothetical protein